MTSEARVGDDFVISPEYKALYSTYEEIREYAGGPWTLLDGGETVIESREALVKHVLDEGKRGLSIQRYKGLGEMNAEELWETTMNPETRTLLQVDGENAALADEIFTMLMGEKVGPRKDFIKTEARKVQNLDV